MSAKATTSSKNRMDCTRATREEVFERYLVGGLSPEDRDAFEEHYFGCPHCFDALQTLQAIRRELPRASADAERNPARVALAWTHGIGLAAAIVLAVGVWLWTRPVSTDLSQTTTARLPSRPAPDAAPPRQSEPAVASGPSLQQLARLEPPPYEPLRLRGIPDEATAHFERGMEQYRKADFDGAIENLRVAGTLDPDAAHIRFFLGVSHLMSGNYAAGIEQLRATIALGDSPYLEDAHFYLAKALLGRKELGPAETQLKELITLGGDRGEEARRLLADVQRLKERPD